MATNTGIDEAVVAQVKKHLFMTEHDVPVGAGQVRSGYFTADERANRLGRGDAALAGTGSDPAGRTDRGGPL